MGQKKVNQWEDKWEFLQWEFLRENKEYQRDFEAVQRGEKVERDVEDKWRLDFLVDPKVSANELCQRVEGNPELIPFPFKAQPVVAGKEVRQAEIRNESGERLTFPKYQTIRDLMMTGDILPLHIDMTYSDKEIMTCIQGTLAVLRNRGVLPRRKNTRWHRQLMQKQLAVWRLWKQGYDAIEIAQKLWPDRAKNDAWIDTDTGEKSPLIRRIYNYRDSAQKRIEDTLPAAFPK